MMSSHFGALARCSGLAFMLVALAASAPVAIHLNNKTVLERADRLFEFSSVHAAPPSVKARIEAKEERDISLTQMYGVNAATLLGQMPPVQLESGLTTLWVSPFLAFLLAMVLLRRRSGKPEIALVAVSGWTIAVCASNAIISLIAVRTLDATFEDVGGAALRMTLTQSVTGGAYLCGFAALSELSGRSLLRFLGTSAATFWLVGSTRLTAGLFDERAARYFLGGAERDLFDPSYAVLARGLAVTTAWAVSFTLLGKALERRRLRTQLDNRFHLTVSSDQGAAS